MASRCPGPLCSVSGQPIVRAASATNHGGLLQGERCDAKQLGCAGAPIDARRREGSPMHTASPCHERKAVISGLLASRPGGARRAGRRCGDGVAFERENPQNKSLSAGQKDSKTDRRFGSASHVRRRAPVVRSPSRKTVSACSRRVRAPANTQQGPERPRKAKSGSATHARRRRARTTRQRCASRAESRF